MKHTGYILILFGIINIVFPDLIAYLIGGFCIGLGGMMILNIRVSGKKSSEENYVKFGNYKIYRNK